MLSIHNQKPLLFNLFCRSAGWRLDELYGEKQLSTYPPSLGFTWRDAMDAMEQLLVWHVDFGFVQTSYSSHFSSQFLVHILYLFPTLSRSTIWDFSKATNYKLFDIKQSNYEEIKVKNLEITCWDDRTPDLNRSGHTGNRNPTGQNDFVFFGFQKWFLKKLIFFFLIRFKFFAIKTFLW